MNKSEVVSVRISGEVYTMLKYITKKRKDRYNEWIIKYGPVTCCDGDISASVVAKQLLVAAIGKEYVEEKNR